MDGSVVSMTRFDSVGFGALNVDKLFKVSRIAEKDEESYVIKTTEAPGGSAANTMVGLARLGAYAGIIGKVAGDREGTLLLDDFKKEVVDARGVALAREGRTGVVYGFVDERGNRALYVASGVNDTLEVEEVNVDYVAETKLLHLTSFVGEKTFETQKRLVEQLHKQVKMSFDPGMLYARRGLSALKPLISRVSIMLPNQAELKLLTGRGFEDGAKSLLDAGVEIVGVKLGAKGCYVTNGKESYLVDAFKVKAEDTTGAGDAWNAGFLYGLSRKKSLWACGKLGNLVASRCITKTGARSGLPKYDDIRHLDVHV